MGPDWDPGGPYDQKTKHYFEVLQTGLGISTIRHTGKRDLPYLGDEMAKKILGGEAIPQQGLGEDVDELGARLHHVLRHSGQATAH